MPTVLRAEGFRVLILFPPREHPPPHVHVLKADGLAVITLETGTMPQRTTRVSRMSAADRRRAEAIVEENTETLMKAWRRIHG